MEFGEDSSNDMSSLNNSNDNEDSTDPTIRPSSPERTVNSLHSTGHADATGDTNCVSRNTDEEEEPRSFAGTISEVQPYAESRSEEYRQLFHLPSEEVLLRDFNCAIQKNILLQGHMYIFVRYICFYSNIFGYERKKIIPLRDITAVHKAKTAGIFPNAIEIEAWGKKHFFGSFLSRDEAYRLIIDGWMQHSEYSKIFFGIQDIGIPSSDLEPSSSSHGTLHDGNHTDSKVIAHEGLENSKTNDQTIATISGRDVTEDSEVREPPINGFTHQDSLSKVAERLVTEISISDTLAEELIVQRDTTGSYITWQIEDRDTPKIPEGYKMVAEAKFSMDVKEFFQLFFGDDGRGFLADFHRKCKDEDFVCTKWSKDRHVGYVREISFRHPINLYFGSKFATCQEVQRFRVYRNSYLVLETSQQMADVPYADCFRVEGRWDIEPVTIGAFNECALRIFVNVAFSKNVFWKGKIEQGAYTECRQVYSTWVADASALLKQRENSIVKTGTDECSISKLPQTEQGTNEQRGLANKSSNAASSRQVSLGRNHNNDDGHVTKNYQQKNGDVSPKSQCQANYIASILQQLQSAISFHWKFGNQLGLVLAIAFAVILLLTQLGVIIMLAKQPRVQFIPGERSSMKEDTWLRVHENSNMEMASWMEQRMFFLKQEMTMLEARMKAIHNEFKFLNLQLQFLDQANSEKKHEKENL